MSDCNLERALDLHIEPTSPSKSNPNGTLMSNFNR